MVELNPLLQQRVNQWMMFIATLQGLAMLLLYRAHEYDWWIATDMAWAVPLWTLVLTLPVFLILSLDSDNVAKALRYSVMLSALMVVSAAYTGTQLHTEQSYSSTSILSVFFLCMVLVAFKGVLYVQQRALGQPMTYPLLFSLSWRNFLVMALALLFVGIVGLLLLLWSALFKVIGIDFFEYLFTKDWFLFPMLGFSFGVGVALFRQLAGVIDNITRLLQALIRFLLPLLVLMTVVFLGSLAVVGLVTLWQTGFGTGLILWLMALLLFFVNAVYQDGRGDPAYSPGVHRLIYLGLLVLPVLAVISFSGLALRVDQYGLTVERVFAWVVWTLLTLFALGYSVSIVRRRDRWTEGLAVVNTRMGLVVLVAMLLLNSPVIDPRKLTVSSQLSRLESGLVTIDDFDVRYFMLHLGLPGEIALDELRQTYGESNPALAQTNPYDYRAAALVTQTPQRFWQQVTLRPAGIEVPPLLVEAVNRTNPNIEFAESLIIAVDMNADGENEFVHVTILQDRVMHANYFMRKGEQWESGALQVSGENLSSASFLRLASEEIKVVSPPLKNVLIGGMVFQPAVRGNLIVPGYPGRPFTQFNPVGGATAAGTRAINKPVIDGTTRDKPTTDKFETGTQQ